jgi:hypothetical protein
MFPRNVVCRDVIQNSDSFRFRWDQHSERKYAEYRRFSEEPSKSC